MARFFASKDFAVNSARLVKGLTLEADDAEFRTGPGPVVRGSLLGLVMAGRRAFLDELDETGLAELRRRSEG